MSAHVAMAHEVRALNSELQALVYQNYSKFLDSTDSIRVMRKELFSMGSRLRDLQGEMKRVADSSARIDARIRPRRQSVGELGEVRSVLQRLETVFALPTKLRMALDRGSLDIATGYYAAARPVLDAFGHQGGLRTVLAECRPLVDRLRRSLRARLADGEEGALDLLEVRPMVPGINSAGLGALSAGSTMLPRSVRHLSAWIMPAEDRRRRHGLARRDAARDAGAGAEGAEAVRQGGRAAVGMRGSGAAPARGAGSGGGFVCQCCQGLRRAAALGGRGPRPAHGRGGAGGADSGRQSPPHALPGFQGG